VLTKRITKVWPANERNVLILATFLAATIEGVEMMAILVGVGDSRRAVHFSRGRSANPHPFLPVTLPPPTSSSAGRFVFFRGFGSALPIASLSLSTSRQSWQNNYSIKMCRRSGIESWFVDRIWTPWAANFSRISRLLLCQSEARRESTRLKTS
jgi:hypothetical protein